jgi:hypothetical protein
LMWCCFRTRFHIWEKIYNTYLAESGFFHLTWWSTRFAANGILLNDWIILHCVFTLHFLYPFIGWWTPRLDYCE